MFALSKTHTKSQKKLASLRRETDHHQNLVSFQASSRNRRLLATKQANRGPWEPVKFQNSGLLEMSWLHGSSSKFKEVISDSSDLFLSKVFGNRRKGGTETKLPGARAMACYLALSHVCTRPFSQQRKSRKLSVGKGHPGCGVKV